MWKRRNHLSQDRHILMFLSGMKKECYFFPSGEFFDPFLLGAAYKAWRNCFLHLKTGSETDLGGEFHTFEITKWHCRAYPKRSRRKVGLVRRDSRFLLQEIFEGFFRRTDKTVTTQQMSCDHQLRRYQALC